MVNTDDLSLLFGQVFPDNRPQAFVAAPGRVNLIGEHTDYNAGFVLPIAMSQALYVCIAPADDDNITVHSTAFSETATFPAADPGPPAEPFWANYVRGMVALLAAEGFAIRPAKLLIHSEVPLGGGVSSSAALEIGTGLALLAMADASMEPIPLALLARQAEHQYANSPCGIMDQFIVALGQADHALLLDCESQACRPIPFKLDDAELVVMNTQVKHSIGESQYPVRQRQCQEGLAVLTREHPEVTTLRNATESMLAAYQSEMEEVTHRRCRHVISEIDRTIRAADALRDEDLTTFGELMFASHASLRDDYEVSCTELDRLVAIAENVPGVYGARMTGGGFGGCAIALIRKDAETTLRSAIRAQYDDAFEKPAIVYSTRASAGASIIE